MHNRRRSNRLKSLEGKRDTGQDESDEPSDGKMTSELDDNENPSNTSGGGKSGHKVKKSKKHKDKDREKKRSKKHSKHSEHSSTEENSVGSRKHKQNQSVSSINGDSNSEAHNCFTPPLPPIVTTPVKNPNCGSSSSTPGHSGTSAGGSPIKQPASHDAGMESPKPEKLKHRWRRNSELESTVGPSKFISDPHQHQSSNNINFGPDNCEQAQPSDDHSNSGRLPLGPCNDMNNSSSVSSSPSNYSTTPQQAVQINVPAMVSSEPMPKFDKIESSIFLFDRKRSKTKRDIKRMVCDCILTKEERQRNIMGCGEDCLNRMLMIECGSRCPLGEQCANKRFQQRKYSHVEPFYAGKKGWGLRATKSIPPGDFVMEYIGEVCDPQEFKSRVKRYHKEKYIHHYFMALKSDEIIDATEKGNITRFVNHSCDPNAETQKWTINGDLRIGFFSLRTIHVGEEVTFDYQFQRYGKEAQKCYCESQFCRGSIGAQEVSQIDLDGTRITPKQRIKIAEIDQKLKANRDEFEDMALDEEVEKLRSVGFLRNRQQTLNLARLMIRAEDTDNRIKLLNIIKGTPEVAYLRLLLDYHGLQLLWSWMVDQEDPWLKSSIIQVLEILPVPNKTMLNDSKVLEMVEKWSKQPPPPPVKITDMINLPSVVKQEFADSTTIGKTDAEVLMKNEPDAEIDVEQTSAAPAVFDTTSSNSEEKLVGTEVEPSGVSEEVADEASNDEDRQREDIEAASEQIHILPKDLIVDTMIQPKLDLDRAIEPTKEDSTETVNEESTSITAIVTHEDASIQVTAEPLETPVETASSLPTTSSLMPLPEDDSSLMESENTPSVSTDESVEMKPSPSLQDVKLFPERQLLENITVPLPNISAMAMRVLNLWKDLKEGFKIPRLVRQKRKDDEQEADRMALKLEELNARGLPVIYGKRGPDDKEYTIAAILKLNQKMAKKPCLDKRLNGSYYGSSANSYNYNLGTTDATESPGQTPAQVQEPQAPKVSKEEHRMQFEMELMRKQYEEAMQNYKLQIEQYHQMLQQTQQQNVAQLPMPFFNPQMPPPPVNCDMSAPPPNLMNGHSSNYQPQQPQLDTTFQVDGSSNIASYPSGGSDPAPYTEHQTFTENEMMEYDQVEGCDVEEAYEQPKCNSGIVLVECSGAENELMTNEAAVIRTDYGIEYVSQNMKQREEVMQCENYPAPGIYYEYDSQVIYAPFDPQQGCDLLDEVQFDCVSDNPYPLVQQYSGALPRYWRRVESKFGKAYYYNKKTGESRWTLPGYAPPPIKIKEEVVAMKSPSLAVQTDELSEETEQNVVSTAESTSPVAQSAEVIDNVVTSTSTPPAPVFSPLENNSANGMPTTPDSQPAAKVLTNGDVDHDSTKEVKQFEPDPRKRRLIETTSNAIEASNSEPTISQSVTSNSQRKSSTTSSSNNHKHHHHHHSHHKIPEKKAKRITEKFRVDMVEHIKKTLNSYRKPDCRVGKIASNEDFKFLAKKLSQVVISKELKNCKSVEDLSCNDTIKQKAKEYVKKYMSSKGPVYNGEGCDKTASSSPVNINENGNSTEINEDSQDQMMNEAAAEEEENQPRLSEDVAT